MEYTVEILESTGSYSNIKVTLSDTATDAETMAQQVWVAQQMLRKQWGSIAKVEQKEKVKDEIKARTEAVEESEVGHKCGKCGDFAPQTVSKKGTRYFLCACGAMGFPSKFKPGEINWKTKEEMEDHK